MNKSVVIILVGAICTAFLVALGVQAMLAPEPQEGPIQVEMTQIIVAKEKLSEGEVIETGKLSWKEWPESALIKGVYVRDGDEDISDLKIIGKPVRREIQLGEPVLSSAIVKIAKEGGNFLAATLAPGKLAFSIPVTPASSVGGFAGPGDHVDVILTYNVRIPRQIQERARGTVQRFASETVLEQVRVLAVDQTSKEEDREAKIGKVVTLEVEPKGAEVLALALEMGDISLALRRLGDDGAVPVSSNAGPTTDVHVSQTLQRLNRLNTAQGNEGSQSQGGHALTTTVKVYRGGQVENVTVPLAQATR